MSPEQAILESRLTAMERAILRLERDSHPPVRNVPDADDVERCFRELIKRIDQLEREIRELRR